jgi:hypothetical protein
MSIIESYLVLSDVLDNIEEVGPGLFSIRVIIHLLLAIHARPHLLGCALLRKLLTCLIHFIY